MDRGDGPESEPNVDGEIRPEDEVGPDDATDDAGAARPPDAPPELGDADGSPRTAAHTAACLLYPEGVSHRRRLAAHGAAPEPNATESADAVDPDANERAKFTDDGEERS